MLFGRGNIPSKTTVVENHNEAFFCWNIFMKEKAPTFLFWRSYNPDRIELNAGTENLIKHLNFYLLKHLKVIVYNGCLPVFCDAFNLKDSQ